MSQSARRFVKGRRKGAKSGTKEISNGITEHSDQETECKTKTLETIAFFEEFKIDPKRICEEARKQR